MRTPKASPQASFVFAIAALSLSALHCSSEDTPPAGSAGTSSQPTSGSGGSAAGTVGTSGGSGGAPTAGSTSGGMPTTAGTVGVGGTTGGSGGSGGTSAGTGGGTSGGTGGAGGSGGGSGGSAGGSGGSGSTVTFAQVQTLITTSCKGSMCHDAGSMFHMDWVTPATLHTNMTTPIPTTKAMQHCKGTTPVVAGNAEGSLLYKVLKGETSCMNGSMTEMIDKMPSKCPGERPCLTEDQIKMVGDWINAGAKM